MAKMYNQTKFGTKIPKQLTTATVSELQAAQETKSLNLDQNKGTKCKMTTKVP